MIPGIRPYLDKLLELVGQDILGIVAYGSFLSQVTKSQDSTPDFFVIVKNYRSFHRRWSHVLMNHILAPSIYHFHVHGNASKYSVVSLSHLQNEVLFPSDMYLVGRFSKHMAIAWEKEASFSGLIQKIQSSAVLTVSRKTLYLMPETFELDDFIYQALSLSYLGDVRVEAGDKIKKIFNAHIDDYRKNYLLALSQLPVKPSDTRPHHFRKQSNAFTSSVGRCLIHSFLFISRIRAQMRWPKAMFTASDWLDYIIQKIERTQNIKIDLTPKQKKLWFIYAWKYFYLLKKKNLIK